MAQMREELVAFNRGRPAAQKLADPMPDAIGAVNEWLHWYHLYRADEPDEDSNAQLDIKGVILSTPCSKSFPTRSRLHLDPIKLALFGALKRCTLSFTGREG